MSAQGAFSEEQVASLSGISRRQLQTWARSGFYKPSYETGERAFSRVYSFRDLVSLRVINSLRNVNNVSMRELRKTAIALRNYGDDAWAKVRMWVLRGKVVFTEPETGMKRELAGNQYVAEVCLEIAVGNAYEDIQKLNVREISDYGRITRTKYVSQSAPVIAGTRIPVKAIKDFANAGYSQSRIIKEYPGLTEADIEAALSYGSESAAA